MLRSPGHARWHEDRLDLQLAGEGTYLIAWSGDRPVGHVFLRLTGSRDPLVRRNLGDCPVLSALSVWPEEYRNQGVGTALLVEAERIASEAGETCLAIGVGDDNPGARRLYERLGYTDWGHGEIESTWGYVDENGRQIRESELITYLVKQLDHG